MQFLTPDMIGRIATAPGLNRSNVHSAIGAVRSTQLPAYSSLIERGSQMLASLLIPAVAATALCACAVYLLAMVAVAAASTS
jgi:hypothetical protein